MEKIVKLFQGYNINVKIADLEQRSSVKPAKKLLNYDIDNVLSIASFLNSKNEGKKLSANKVVSYLEADYWLRTSTWILLRRIEEKLTAAFQQKIAYNKEYGEDFYLKISNFNSKGKGNNEKQIKHRRELSKFMNDLKVFQHTKLFNENHKFIIENDYYPFSKLLSIMSYTQKYKILKFMKPEDQNLILNKFGVNEMVWAFQQMRFLRNQIAHHGLLINKTFVSNEGGKTKVISIAEMIDIMKRLSSPIEAKKYKKILESADDKTKEIFKSLKLIV